LDAAIFNYLVGNNDAHGKNFSLVYPDKETRLAPLYDVISTIFYPELAIEMAMRIGREYSSDRVTPKDFEQLAEDAGLAKPLVRRRVPELATVAIEALGKIKISGRVSDEVADLIRKRCARAREKLHG
jgi:serine/threonine-protein kinase HipA